MSVIETERLLLRPFREDDAADLLEYLSGPLPHCFAGLKLNTLDEARAEVVKRGGDTEYCFAIVLKDTGRVIGEIDAQPSNYEPPMLCSRRTPLPPPDTFTPSIILNPAYQGRGLAYEATYAFYDYLFMRKGVRRIYLYVDDYNARSQHLCEKLGLRREGLFREFVSFVDGADGNPVHENALQPAAMKREWMTNGRNKSGKTRPGKKPRIPGEVRGDRSPPNLSRVHSSFIFS